MMGRDPDETLPANAIRKRMDRLAGSYAIYSGLETLRVWKRGGLLYMGSEEPGTPLIPEDPTYASHRFFTLREGLKSPVEFQTREDGSVVLIVERYVYHKGP